MGKFLTLNAFVGVLEQWKLNVRKMKVRICGTLPNCQATKYFNTQNVKNRLFYRKNFSIYVLLLTEVAIQHFKGDDGIEHVTLRFLHRTASIVAASCVLIRGTDPHWMCWIHNYSVRFLCGFSATDEAKAHTVVESGFSQLWSQPGPFLM